jgi:hypothetical protein
MAGWSAATLIPQSFIASKIREATNPQDLIIRRALTQSIVSPSTPAATNPKTPATPATPAITNVVPKSTSGGNSATSVTPTDNKPDFLNGQNQSANPQQDFLDMLQQALGGQKQDPELVKAQTVLAQQQAMQVARDNEAARNRESNMAAQGYLQSQLKDAANYNGSVGNILTQRYNDRLKVLQSGQDLNWLTMPSSSYSVPKRSGWTGPAMPGTWGL